jgi:hypothetical protein
MMENAEPVSIKKWLLEELSVRNIQQTTGVHHQNYTLVA